MTALRANASIWEAQNFDPNLGMYFPRLSSDINCEVCVIGAGITGVCLAYLLAKENVDVVLLEAKTVGLGSSSGSIGQSGLLTDIMLKDMIRFFGMENSLKILESNHEALELLETLVREYAIDCDFKKTSGGYIAQSAADTQALEEELEAALKLGLNPVLERMSDSLYASEARLIFDSYILMNPLKFVFELAKAAKMSGARIYQKSVAREVTSGQVDLDKAKVKARHVVMATHIPLGLHPLIQNRVFPMRSYVIGARVKEEIEECFLRDLGSPYVYLRKARDSKGELLLVGGYGHRVGEHSNNPYGSLQGWLMSRMSLESVDYTWSTQYYQSADGMPYIGRMQGHENLWFATGLEGAGLSHGALAAKIICDGILGRENEFAKIYSPNRLHLGLAGKRLLKGNFNSAKDFIKDRMERPQLSAQELAPGEGAIVMEDGEKLACYKDMEGDVHTMSPVCTHAKCHVRWNGLEKSWDCPCHGGRYSATGEVICGPPTHDLKKVDLFVARAGTQAEPRA